MFVQIDQELPSLFTAFIQTFFYDIMPSRRSSFPLQNPFERERLRERNEVLERVNMALQAELRRTSGETGQMISAMQRNVSLREQLKRERERNRDLMRANASLTEQVIFLKSF